MLDRLLSDKHYPLDINVHKLSFKFASIWNLMKFMTGLIGFQCTRPSLKVSTDAIFVRDKRCFQARCLAPDLLITPFSCKYSQPTAPSKNYKHTSRKCTYMPCMYIIFNIYIDTHFNARYMQTDIYNIIRDIYSIHITLYRYDGDILLEAATLPQLLYSISPPWALSRLPAGQQPPIAVFSF